MIEIYYVAFDNSLPIRVPVLKSSGYNDTPVPIAQQIYQEQLFCQVAKSAGSPT